MVKIAHASLHMGHSLGVARRRTEGVRGTLLAERDGSDGADPSAIFEVGEGKAG